MNMQHFITMQGICVPPVFTQGSSEEVVSCFFIFFYHFCSQWKYIDFCPHGGNNGFSEFPVSYEEKIVIDQRCLPLEIILLCDNGV